MSGLKNTSDSEYSYINDLLKSCDLKNLFVFEVSSKNCFSVNKK